MNEVAASAAGGPVRLLVSVRSVDEALLAAHGGADFIDLKDPAQGALGGLPVATIRAIVAALRERRCAVPVSATIGDWPAGSSAAIVAAVAAVAGCGVDYVKVGIAPGRAAAAAEDWPAAGVHPRSHGPADPAPGAPATAGQLLPALAASPWPVVPVFTGDDGVDAAAVALACRLRVARGAACFPAMMVDTQDKRGGSLFQCAPADALRRFLNAVRATGAMAGLAGALRLADLPALAALAPDFAGFRSAVCVADRAGALDGGLLAALRNALPAAPRASAGIGAPGARPFSAAR